MQATRWTFLAVAIGCGSRTQLGTPEPIEATDSGVTIDASHDVVVDTPADSADASDATSTIAECEASAMTVLATSPYVPSQVALDDSFVYWAEYDSIRRVSKAGGTPQTIGSGWLVYGPSVAGFGLDATHIYFVTEMYHLMSVPKGGGTYQDLFQGLYSELPLVVVDGPNAYEWSGENDTTLYRVPVAGGSATVVTTLLPPYTNAMAIDANVAYVSSEAKGTFAVALTNGSVTQLDTTPSWNVITDSSYVYFTTGSQDPNGTNAVMRVSKNGGPAAQVATGLDAFAMALDGDTLYFTDRVAGSINRVPKEGGVPVKVAADQYPDAIALDERCIYWTNAHGVMATPK